MNARRSDRKTLLEVLLSSVRGKRPEVSRSPRQEYVAWGKAAYRNSEVTTAFVLQDGSTSAATPQSET